MCVGHEDYRVVAAEGGGGSPRRRDEDDVGVGEEDRKASADAVLEDGGLGVNDLFEIVRAWGGVIRDVAGKNQRRSVLLKFGGK